MRSTTDLKVLTIAGCAVGYPLAVIPPVLIDPLLKTHALFPTPRHYPYAYLCIAIYVAFLCTQLLLFSCLTTLKAAYFSVCTFIVAIFLTFPIFLPEFPHGNVLDVGVLTSFLTAFSIFVWSIVESITNEFKNVSSPGKATLEYIKALSTFVRQGAFAGVTLFGALFFASFSTAFQYNSATVTDKADHFLLNLNLSVQMAFYAIYSVIGVVRYFFLANMDMLRVFKMVAAEIDLAEKTKPTGEILET